MRYSTTICCLGLALASAPAHAYLDPGTGSILVQSLIAGIVAVLVFFRTIKDRVRDFLSRRKPEHDRKKEQARGLQSDE